MALKGCAEDGRCRQPHRSGPTGRDSPSSPGQQPATPAPGPQAQAPRPQRTRAPTQRRGATTGQQTATPTPTAMVPIQRIVVQGNQRIEPATVISYMLIHPGDTFDAE